MKTTHVYVVHGDLYPWKRGGGQWSVLRNQLAALASASDRLAVHIGSICINQFISWLVTGWGSNKQVLISHLVKGGHWHNSICDCMGLGKQCFTEVHLLVGLCNGRCIQGLNYFFQLWIEALHFLLIVSFARSNKLQENSFTLFVVNIFLCSVKWKKKKNVHKFSKLKICRRKILIGKECQKTIFLSSVKWKIYFKCSKNTISNQIRLWNIQ